VTEYYHGTCADLAVGDTILPATELGLDLFSPDYTSRETSDPYRVYVTTDVAQAWYWALGDMDLGTPTIYRVEPIGKLRRDILAFNSFSCRRARILARSPVPPVKS